jgi:hypothetical protein
MEYIKMKKLSKSFAVIALATLSSQVYADNFSVLDLFYHRNIDTPWVRVITNQADWESYYRELQISNDVDPDEGGTDSEESPPYYPPSEPPYVDFSSHQVIIGSLGVKPSSGYDLVVSEVTADLDSQIYNITLLDISPAEECVLLPALTYPEAAIVVSNQIQNFNYNIEQLEVHCQ